MTPPPLRGGLVAVAALLALTGCGGGNAAPSGPMGAGSPSPTHTGSGTSPKPKGAATEATASVIKIWSYAYTGPASVKAGSTVTVKNEDSVTHTITADGKGGFDVVVPADTTTTFTAPSKPGSYPYHCTYHGNMHGTLKVT